MDLKELQAELKASIQIQQEKLAAVELLLSHVEEGQLKPPGEKPKHPGREPDPESLCGIVRSELSRLNGDRFTVKALVASSPIRNTPKNRQRAAVALNLMEKKGLVRRVAKYGREVVWANNH